MLLLGQFNQAVYAQVNILSTLNLKFATFGDLVSLFVKLSLWLAGFLLFAGMIYAGINMMSSGGNDPKAMEANKQMLTNSLIGFILVIAAVAIVKLIEAIMGITILG